MFQLEQDYRCWTPDQPKLKQQMQFFEQAYARELLRLQQQLQQQAQEAAWLQQQARQRAEQQAAQKQARQRAEQQHNAIDEAKRHVAAAVPQDVRTQMLELDRIAQILMYEDVEPKISNCITQQLFDAISTHHTETKNIAPNDLRSLFRSWRGKQNDLQERLQRRVAVCKDNRNDVLFQIIRVLMDEQPSKTRDDWFVRDIAQLFRPGRQVPRLIDLYKLVGLQKDLITARREACQQNEEIAKAAAATRHLWVCDALDASLRERHNTTLKYAIADLGILNGFITTVQNHITQLEAKKLDLAKVMSDQSDNLNKLIEKLANKKKSEKELESEELADKKTRALQSVKNAINKLEEKINKQLELGNELALCDLELVRLWD